MAVELQELMKLSPMEKLNIIDILWDSIEESEVSVVIPNELLEELDRRAEEHERDPGSAVTWEVAKQRILSSHEK